MFSPNPIQRIALFMAYSSPPSDACYKHFNVKKQNDTTLHVLWNRSFFENWAGFVQLSISRHFYGYWPTIRAILRHQFDEGERNLLFGYFLKYGPHDGYTTYTIVPQNSACIDATINVGPVIIAWYCPRSTVSHFITARFNPLVSLFLFALLDWLLDQ